MWHTHIGRANPPGQLDQQMAGLATAHHDAVHRLADVRGLGVDFAQPIIAEVGATFVGRGDLSPESISTGRCDFEFTLEKEARDLEFRVFVGRKTKLKLDSISIERLHAR